MKLRKQCIYSCMYSGILFLWTLHSHITLFQLSLDAEKDPVTVLLLGRLYIVMPPPKLCQHSVSLQDFFWRSHSADSAGCHPHFASSLHRLPHSFPECWVVLKIRMKCTNGSWCFNFKHSDCEKSSTTAKSGVGSHRGTRILSFWTASCLGGIPIRPSADGDEHHIQ